MKKYLPCEASTITGLKNFNIMMDGSIRTVGYSSLRGLIKMLKHQNKSLKKLGCKVKFEFTLPIPD